MRFVGSLAAVRLLGPVGLCLLAAGCGNVPRPAPRETVSVSPPKTVQAASAFSPASPNFGQSRQIRATGTIRAVSTLSIGAPQISGQNPRLTVTAIAANGVTVNKGDPLVEFDRTQPADELRELQSKVDELTSQLEGKRAENRTESAKRLQEMREAEADLAKARIQLSKGPILSDIDRLKSEVRVETALKRIASLTKSYTNREKAEAAALRVLELKRDRQQVGLERAKANLERLVIRAPIGGMVALLNTWRNGTMGPTREGDQVFPGRPILTIFDPGRMMVETEINQADGAALAAGTRAKVRLDAYPALVFDAVLEFASPVASSNLDTPIRVFPARFRLEQTDPRLLPDLSAGVDIDLNAPLATADSRGPDATGKRSPR